MAVTKGSDDKAASKDIELVLMVDSVVGSYAGEIQKQDPAVIKQPDPKLSEWNDLNQAAATSMVDVTVVEETEKGYSETDGTIESRCETCRQTAFVRWISFLVLFVLDFAEFIFDWLFFYEVVTIRKGLVFGEPEPALIWTLLGLCLLGTVVFFIETWSTYRAKVQNNKWSLGYAPTLVDVWLVNIPSGIINAILAACYESAISYVQLAKALAAMILVLVKIINAIVGYCQELRLRRRYKIKGTKIKEFPIIVKLAILVGVLAILVCSSFVFAVTHMTMIKHGGNLFIKVQAPSSWEDVKIDSSKYFDRVSVYLQHPSFSEPCGTDSKANRWMQLNTIYDVIEAEDQGLLITFGNVTLDIRNQYFYVAMIWPYQNKTTSEHCYHRDLSTCAINELNCRALDSIISKADNFTLRLLYEPATEFVLIGNINYNGYAMRKSKCTSLSDKEDDMIKLIGKLHYFRNSRAGNNPLPFEDKDTYFFSSESGDMKDVAKEWFTGTFRCKTGGYSGPTYSEYVTVRTC
jgi:hypothetical protein